MSVARLRRSVRSFLENPQSRGFTVVNDVLALVTVASVLALILETVAALSEYHAWFKAVEYVSVFLFTLEYLGRLWAAESRLRYAFSFFGIVDLLSIVPTYLAIANLTFLKTSRALRILRFLRMLRLAKLARVHHKHKGARALYLLNIQIYAAALFTAVLLLGSSLFLLEHSNPSARDLPTAMLWAFKVILGGVQYDQPQTAFGIAVLIAGRFTSLILLGLMFGLMTTMVRKALIGSESDA